MKKAAKKPQVREKPKARRNITQLMRELKTLSDAYDKGIITPEAFRKAEARLSWMRSTSKNDRVSNNLFLGIIGR